MRKKLAGSRNPDKAGSHNVSYQTEAEFARGWGVRAALALIRGYTLLLSPYFGGSCRFVPSCAAYARDAVILHGVIRGSWLTFRRLIRCHPLCAGGLDPVPCADEAGSTPRPTTAGLAEALSRTAPAGTNR